MKYLNSSSVVQVKTKQGTDLKLYKRNRTERFFNGVVRDGKGFSSASIEVYVPIEETKTEGIMIPDGSLGYIGKVEKPFKIGLKEGRIQEIEMNASGKKLKAYMEDFIDPGIYVASELGNWPEFICKMQG